MSKKSLHNLSEHFLELENRINRVRFARIEAAKRLRIKNQKYTLITSCYAIFVTFLAIIFSVVDFTDISTKKTVTERLFDYQKISVIILGFSSFITMLTLYLSNKGYGEKTARFQSNYMELTRLHSDVKNFMVYYQLHSIESFKDFKKQWLEDDKQREKTKDLEKRLAKKYRTFADKYSALLTQSENHEDVDYKRARIEDLSKEIEALEREKIRYAASKKLADEKLVIINNRLIDHLKIKKKDFEISIYTEENKDLIKYLILMFSPFLLAMIALLFYITFSLIGTVIM